MGQKQKNEIRILCGFEGVICNCKSPENRKKIRSNELQKILEVPYQNGLLEFLEEIAVYAPNAVHTTFVRCEHGRMGSIANAWLARNNFAMFDGVLQREKVIEFKSREEFLGVCENHDAHIVISDHAEYLTLARAGGVKYLVLFQHQYVSRKENDIVLERTGLREIYYISHLSELIPIMKKLTDIVSVELL